VATAASGTLDTSALVHGCDWSPRSTRLYCRRVRRRSAAHSDAGDVGWIARNAKCRPDGFASSPAITHQEGDTSERHPRIPWHLGSCARGSDSIEHQLAALHALQIEHPFWNCRLLAAFAQGTLSRDDIRYVFSQYHLYSSSFTRLIAAVMASSENVLHRAQLAQNLWEEGGGCEPSRRQPRSSATSSARRSASTTCRGSSTRRTPGTVAREYLAQCQRPEPVWGTAFLSLGTEGIVSRMYEIIRGGLLLAGSPLTSSSSSTSTSACDDDHASRWWRT